MADLPEILGRIKAMQEEIGTSLDGFGGFLRCQSCGHTTPLSAGDGKRYTAHGWPQCCGQTMRWWTQNQIDKGEVKP